MPASERTIDHVLGKMDWMREKRIWPNGLRDLWADAFGLVLLISLYRELDQEKYLDQAEMLADDVHRTLGLEKGLRIGEAWDQEGQYYHYLAMWVYALDRLGRINPERRNQAVALVKDFHPHFYVPGAGVYWKMEEDLSGPWAETGLGALDPFQGYVVYRLLAPDELADEIKDMEGLVQDMYQELTIDQDLGLGMMLWMTHFFPREAWAEVQADRSLKTLDHLWVDPPGYFRRRTEAENEKYAYTNYGVVLGLKAVGTDGGRIPKTLDFFEHYRSNDGHDADPVTHVMALCAHFPGELIIGG